MKERPRFSNLLVALLLLSQLRPLDAQASRVMGCWQIKFSAWNPSPPGRDSDLYQPMPNWLRLLADTSHGYLRAARRPNRPPKLLGQPDSLRAFWRPLTRDSIELWFPVRWSTGVRARMGIFGDTLRGDASIYVDFAPYDTPHSRVNAHRVPCSAAPNDR